MEHIDEVMIDPQEILNDIARDYSVLYIKWKMCLSENCILKRMNEDLQRELSSQKSKRKEAMS